MQSRILEYSSGPEFGMAGGSVEGGEMGLMGPRGLMAVVAGTGSGLTVVE